jgi:hypothetical protein
MMQPWYEWGGQGGIGCCCCGGGVMALAAGAAGAVGIGCSWPVDGAARRQALFGGAGVWHARVCAHKAFRLTAPHPPTCVARYAVIADMRSPCACATASMSAGRLMPLSFMNAST